MNKRIKKKFIKNLLNANLDKKIYGKEIYQDACKNCKYKYESTSDDEEYYNCHMECYADSQWFEYKFDDRDIDKLMSQLIGKMPLNDEIANKRFKFAKYYLWECYNIKGYDFIFDEGLNEIKNKHYERQLEILGRGNEYILDIKPYFIIKKVK